MVFFNRLFKPKIKDLERKRDVDGLVKAMWFDNLNIRVEAIKALKRIGPDARQAVPALIQALMDTEDVIRMEAVSALGRIKDERAVEHLIKALNDRQMCHSAIYALEKIGDPGAVQPLIEALENSETVISAISALGTIGDKRAVEPLLKKLRSMDKAIREAAVLALNDLDEVPNFNRIKKFWDVRARTRNGQVGEEREVLTFIRDIYETIRRLEEGITPTYDSLSKILKISYDDASEIIDYLIEEHCLKAKHHMIGLGPTAMYDKTTYSLTGQYKMFFPKRSRKPDAYT